MERGEDWSDIPRTRWYNPLDRHKFSEEKWNVIFDAWRARTPEEWELAVNYYNLLNPLSDISVDLAGVHFKSNKQKNEDHLKKMINANADTLINLEIQARKGMRQRILDELKEKNIPIPDIPEFDEDKEKNRLIERANSRALSVGRDELELTGWKDIPGSFFFWNRGLLRPKKKKEKTLYEKLYEILERD